MDVVSRNLRIRTLELMKNNSEKSKRLGLKDNSKFLSFSKKEGGNEIHSNRFRNEPNFKSI